MQRVLVLDAQKNPLMPCQPARARELLRKGKAAVFRHRPFTIILKDRISGTVQVTQIKLDPGSKTTGIAVNAHFKRGITTIWGAELAHRGTRIKLLLEGRRAVRRGRRNRHTRYRAARWRNRAPAKCTVCGRNAKHGSRFCRQHSPRSYKAGENRVRRLQPSLKHRVHTTLTWVERLARWTPSTQVSQELVRFDMQQMDNPEIDGVEYQQGTLRGYEVREYLLEKWQRKCAYCGAENVPLEIEHIHPKSLGGTNRISNLALACHACNQKKGNRPLTEFLAKHPDKLRAVLRQATTPLLDAAAVNSARWDLWETLKVTGLAIEVGTGGRTKYNRLTQRYPKAHWIDAACVGTSGEHVRVDKTLRPLIIKAMGHGTRRMCQTDKFGFPILHRARIKRYFGFATGDLVEASPQRGKHKGQAIVGRVTVSHTGNFKIMTAEGKISSSHKYCRLLQRADGYDYSDRAPEDETKEKTKKKGKKDRRDQH